MLNMSSDDQIVRWQKTEVAFKSRYHPHNSSFIRLVVSGVCS